MGYGSWDRQQLGLDSGGSLSERLSYRMTVNQQAGNGWVDRTDSRSLALSAALRFDATDDLSFTLAHERGDAEPANYYGTPLIDGHYRSSLRKKNYNIQNDVQRYHDEWTRLNTDWTLSDSVSASNQLYYIKAAGIGAMPKPTPGRVIKTGWSAAVSLRSSTTKSRSATARA